MNRLLTRAEFNESLKPLSELVKAHLAAIMEEMKPGEERMVWIAPGFAPLLVQKPHEKDAT